MLAFADDTGLSSSRPPRRYLWTDAFAVCNFIGLWRLTGEDRYQDLAVRLVDQVHEILGRHRPDDGRTGWLGGLGAEASAHPTRGGLRIGKPLPERRPDQPFDERLEWNRDGQYLHYLTRWMHALDQVARATGQAHFNRWARELAEVAHRAFSLGRTGGPNRRLVWKMSIDLTRPLVPSMGQHDALDALITCVQLRDAAAQMDSAATGPDLTAQAADLAAMVENRDLATLDPLGLGGLLTDAARVAQLMNRGEFADGRLLGALLAAAEDGLSQGAGQEELRQPASRRLAFRELGLAIGLSAATLAPALAPMTPLFPMASKITSFWLDPQHHRSAGWIDHRDINEVMLATALLPDGFVVLLSQNQSRLAGAGRGNKDEQ